MRFRLSGLYATGDGDPYNNTEGGFDAIFENPIFGGADTSYWIRQTIPFAGGGRAVAINGRNGILNSLRSSKEEGQSNFRSEEHTSELQSLMRISYAVFCLKKKKKQRRTKKPYTITTN